MHFKNATAYLSIAITTAALVLASGCTTLGENDVPREPPSPVKAGGKFIELDGGGCMFSGCPDYDFYIFSDGRILFRRQHGSEVLQTLYGQIDRQKFKYLEDAFEGTKFFTRPDDQPFMSESAAAWVSADFGSGLKRRYIDSSFQLGTGSADWLMIELLIQVADVEDYSARGINGPLEQLLFPITHGTLFFPGMDVLPTYAVYGTGRIAAEGVAAARATWRLRLERIFQDAPIPFRPQNGGDYPDGHVLASHVAAGQSGLPAHVAEMRAVPQ